MTTTTHQAALIEKLHRLGSDFTSHPVSRGIDDCEEAGAAMLEAWRVLSAPPPQEAQAPTGWPAELLQDQSRELSRALSNAPHAKRHASEAAAAIAQEAQADERAERALVLLDLAMLCIADLTGDEVDDDDRARGNRTVDRIVDFFKANPRPWHSPPARAALSAQPAQEGE